MRVAFIINDLSGGGAEKALKLLSGYLSRNGVETGVITLQSGNDGYQLDDGIDRVTLRSSRLSRGPGKILALPLQGAELARVIRLWNPDLCVSFLPRSNIAHVMTRIFGNRRPVVLTEQASSRHTYPRRSVSDWTMRNLIRYCYPKADAVFPSSEGVRDGLTRFGVREAIMHVVYNAISISDIQESTREISEIPHDEVPTAITVGRHVEQKDHETLLRAFAIVRKQMMAKLILVGQGPRRNELDVLCRNLCIEDCVLFAGWQQNPFAWMSRADLFVLSSRFEGFGNVLVEAMACGLPVISTDCPSGPREIVCDGRAGLLVPVGDANALASAMLSVFQNHALKKRLTEESRVRARAFDIGVIGPAYLELLRRILRSHGQSNL